MNYLDIIIAVPLLYGLIKGFSNGLVKEVTSLLALFIGVYVAINFSSPKKLGRTILPTASGVCRSTSVSSFLLSSIMWFWLCSWVVDPKGTRPPALF